MDHIECNKLYMILLVHKPIQRNHLSYYTCQTSIYCTICCLLVVKQLQKVSKLHTSFFKTKKNKLVFYIFFVKGNTSRFGSAIQVLPCDMEYFDSRFLTVIAVVFYFYLYIAMEKCKFLSIVISFVRNISLLIYLLTCLLACLLVCLLACLLACLLIQFVKRCSTNLQA